MSNRDVQKTRRTVLKAAGGAAVGLTAVAGAASAKHLDPDPDVETVAAEAFTSDSACLDGDLNSLGGATTAEVFFEWDVESSSDFSNETTHETVKSTGSFDAHVDGLRAETTYKARAVAVASDGDRDVGFTETFTTNSDGTFG